MLKTKKTTLLQQQEVDIRFPRINKIINKPAGTIILMIIVAFCAYFTILNFEGILSTRAVLISLPLIGSWLSQFHAPINHGFAVVFFPMVVGMSTWTYMIIYSDHKELLKDRFTAYRRFSLTDNRFGNWLIKKRWFQSLLTVPNFMFFLMVVVTGWFGYGGYLQKPDAGFTNGATFLTWNVWWVGMILTFPLAGRLWCTMCPLGTVGEWAHRTHVPKHLTTASLIMRYVSAAIFAIIAGMITAVSIGTIFFHKSITYILGNQFGAYILSPSTVPADFTIFNNPIGFLIASLAYFTAAPGNVVVAFFTTFQNDAFPMGQLVGFTWAMLTVFGVVLGAVIGFVIKDYLRAAFVGTPLIQDEDPKRPYPKRISTLWVTILLFAGIMMFDFAVGMFVNPLFTAFFIFILIALSVILGVFYERRAFCMYVCPLAGIIGTYGSSGAVELRNKDMAVCSACKTKDCLRGRNEMYGYSAMAPDRKVNFEWSAGYACPMGEFTMVMESNLGCIMCTECIKSCRNDNINIAVRPLSLDLFLKKKKSFEEAALAAVLVGVTLALILPDVPEVSTFTSGVITTLFQNELGLNGIMAQWVFIVVWFAFAAFLMPIGLFFIACKIAMKLGGITDMKLKDMFTTFAYAIIPIGLVTHAAYWFVRLFDHLPSAVKVLMDPFGGQFMGFPLYTTSASGAVTFNWTNPIVLPIVLIYAANPLFATVHNMAFPNLMSEDFTFFFRVSVLYLGLAYAVFAAYKTTIKKYGVKDTRRAMKIMLPLAAYMMFFTMMSIFVARTWIPS